MRRDAKNNGGFFIHDNPCRRVGIVVWDFQRKEICVMKKLSYGSAGAEVERLQAALCRAGYGPLEIDGDFGRETRAALAAFQLDRRLAGDGALGPETAALLAPLAARLCGIHRPPGRHALRRGAAPRHWPARAGDGQPRHGPDGRCARASALSCRCPFPWCQRTSASAPRW